jgi:crotonobetainyl-CoA hydratase
LAQGGFAGLIELFDLDKPVIAGYSAGGGFEPALACDLIVASSHAQFWLSEVSLGIVPDVGGVLWLPPRLPRHRHALLLTGR